MQLATGVIDGELPVDGGPLPVARGLPGGNSAIAAVAPVINADKSEIASSIALTAVIGVLLVL